MVGCDLHGVLKFSQEDGAKTISGTHEQFISEETKPCSQLRRQEYQDSSEKGRVKTANN